MPIYEYVCEACGAETEIMHKISETPSRECPACGKPALTKMVSASGFRLGGGGWYETDFKSAGKKNLASDSGGSDSSCSPAGCAQPGCAASGSDSSS